MLSHQLTLQRAGKARERLATDIQDPGIRYTEIAKEKNITPYQAPFFNRLVDALSQGWQGFSEFLIFLSRFWIFLILAVIGFGVFMKQFPPVKK